MQKECHGYWSGCHVITAVPNVKFHVHICCICVGLSQPRPSIPTIFFWITPNAAEAIHSQVRAVRAATTFESRTLAWRDPHSLRRSDSFSSREAFLSSSFFTFSPSLSNFLSLSFKALSLTTALACMWGMWRWLLSIHQWEVLNHLICIVDCLYLSLSLTEISTTLWFLLPASCSNFYSRPQFKPQQLRTHFGLRYLRYDLLKILYSSTMRTVNVCVVQGSRDVTHGYIWDNRSYVWVTEKQHNL